MSDPAPCTKEDPAALISVIIPCYNQAHFLAEAIDSVLAQDYPVIEIIVVDDGSYDATAVVATDYAEVRYIHQANQGLSGARNTGLAASRGHYLVFLDADDRITPNALRDGWTCLQEHPDCAFVSGHHRYINADGSLRNDYRPEPIDDDPYLALLERNYIGMHATVMYTRDVFEAVGLFDTTLKSCEDYDLYLRIARDYPVYRHDHLVAEYRWHGANMTNNAARMLGSALSVLRSQWTTINRQPEYQRAAIRGIRFWRGYFGGQVIARIHSNVRARRWHTLATNLHILLRFVPAFLVSVRLELILRLHTRGRKGARMQCSFRHRWWRMHGP
ncbi:MAG: hypothetical protein AVDCRST_MAG93-9956 [uncultured Chloroflexia bacterium]|uniref:Glycosyltransferase 2-like domain-containing protein n=1 Tax=uncultured Chloroflexia bacterium TaxID=1672391 RepID=A0A6J4NYV0_9CHLR|nr:MAG: hypothetical protein AVDCRST_MAG93-9956 [uncultured Chloroflexia bacterium]